MLILGERRLSTLTRRPALRKRTFADSLNGPRADLDDDKTK